jgi:predicted dehydrogenase
MTAGKLRLGVIGAGSWTVASHLPAFARHRDVLDFSIVNRRDPVMLEQIRSGFGFARATTNWEDVIEERLDIVLVASPAALHHAQARAALDSGAHVLCEKPFTVSAADAWDLDAHARALGRHLVVAFGWNYRPMVVEAQRLLAENGGIGELEHLAVYMASATRDLLTGSGTYLTADPTAAPRTETWMNPSLSGGGYGQAQLSHALGIAFGITGLRAAEVFAFLGHPGGSRVELHDALAVRFTNGSVGTIAGASNHPGARSGKHQVELRAIGSEGQLLLDLERELLWRHRAPSDDVSVPFESGAGRYECDGPVDAIVDLARGRGTNRSPAAVGARTVELLDAAYRSATSGRPEPVDLATGGAASGT